MVGGKSGQSVGAGLHFADVLMLRCRICYAILRILYLKLGIVLWNFHQILPSYCLFFVLNRDYRLVFWPSAPSALGDSGTGLPFPEHKGRYVIGHSRFPKVD